MPGVQARDVQKVVAQGVYPHATRGKLLHSIRQTFSEDLASSIHSDLIWQRQRQDQIFELQSGSFTVVDNVSTWSHQPQVHIVVLIQTDVQFD